LKGKGGSFAALRTTAAALGTTTVLLAAPLHAQDRGAAALGDLVRGLGTTARVLVMAAHPDDEDTQLITWLARGRQVETAYLSLTRGDGGQNLIGNELGEALGAIRTEELLAARRVDGGHQFFSRAYDFGFSKTAEETYLHWPKDSILGDAVKVVRAFRPHVIVAVFSGTPRDGHGHHQVSGLLARELFELAAADTVRFPVARFGPAWTVQKFYRGARFGQADPTLRFDVGEYNPVLGRGYGEIAGESRSQHKSQGFGVLQRRGESIDMLKREGTRVNEATPAASEAGLFDGMDTTFARLRDAIPAAERPRLDTLGALLARVRARLDLFDPSASVGMLDSVVRVARTLCPRAASPWRCAPRAGAPALAADLESSLATLAGRAEGALELAGGLAIEAVVTRATYARNDAMPVAITLYNRGRVPVRILAAGETGLAPAGEAVTVAPGKSWTASRRFAVTAASAPYWLATPRAGDIFTATPDVNGDDRHAGSPQAAVLVQLGESRLELHTPVVFRYADPVKGEIQRPVAVAPAVTLTLGARSEYAPANRSFTRALRVTLRSAQADTQRVTLALALPAGLVADSATRTLVLPPGAERVVDVALRGRLPVGRHEVRATASVNGEKFETGYQSVEYDHIRPQALYRPAVLAIQAVDITLPARANIAYVPGVGDNVAPALAQLGFAVTIVEPARLATTPLDDFAAVVVGPRAFEANPELIAQAGKLNAYAAKGGTVVTQYGQYEMTRPGVLPFGITLTRPAARVTLEDAPVTVLDPKHPLLASPNALAAKDFEGWVQERALYMPSTIDAGWTPLLEMNDPSEPANRGALLVGKVGQGTYVYTTLSLFRQLPAGNPGAARLFANLIAAGQGRKVTP
jgi:LmbE family N-acetylglucosaminyl deacetylase